MAQLAPRWRGKACIFPSIADEMPSMKSHTERKKYIAWVAMLRQAKRPDLLVEIAQKARTVRFVVCGGPSTHRSPPGYGKQIVEALRAQPNIEYRGQVAPEEASHVIANASVLLSTSDEEGFPNTFLHAWSSGTPVVSLKIDPDYIIRQKGMGMVSHSVDGAVADLTTLTDSPQRCDEIGVRARRYIAENHCQDAVAEMFVQAILNGC